MVRKLAYAAGAIVIVGAATFWVLTTPQTVDQSVIAALQPGDATKGEHVFWAGAVLPVTLLPARRVTTARFLPVDMNWFQILAHSLRLTSLRQRRASVTGPCMTLQMQC